MDEEEALVTTVSCGFAFGVALGEEGRPMGRVKGISVVVVVPQ